MNTIAFLPESHPFTAVAQAQWTCKYDLAYQKAVEFLSIPPIEDTLDPIYNYQFTMYPFAHAIVLYNEARRLLRARQDGEASETLAKTVEVIEQVKFWEDLHDQVYQMLRQLHLLARVRGMVAKAADSLSRGMLDQALRECRQIEATYLDDLVTLSHPDQPPEDLHMRPVASVLLPIVLNAGALVYMRHAVMGKSLRNAARYFEKMTKTLETYNAHQSAKHSMSDIVRLSEAAALRVKGEIIASEDRYKDAVNMLDQAAFAFDSLASEYSADTTTSDLVRDFIITAAEETAQSVRHYDRMALMQSKLDAARAASAAERARLEDLESYHRDAMLTFARQELGVNVSTVVDVKNTVNIRNTIAVTVQDQAMDEVVKLLNALPEDKTRNATLEKAREAKSEQDIAAKIKKVAAVIDATAKLANGAAKLVPYGPMIIGVLKGVFSMLSDSGDTDHPVQQTTQV